MEQHPASPNPALEPYFDIGCGRCKKVATPDCKVNFYREGLLRLRQMLLNCGLQEERKWSMPCYTIEKKNVLILAAFRPYFSLNFLRGNELKDPNGMLEKAGEHSQAARQLRFRSDSEVEGKKDMILGFIRQAVELEKNGMTATKSAAPLIPIPEELAERFQQDSALKIAFHNLSPGRRRSYLLHFTSAKQASTRMTRIEKCIPSILAGKGFQEKGK